MRNSLLEEKEAPFRYIQWLLGHSDLEIIKIKTDEASILE
jgi:site-specific recombinase XerD